MVGWGWGEGGGSVSISFSVLVYACQSISGLVIACHSTSTSLRLSHVGMSDLAPRYPSPGSPSTSMPRAASGAIQILAA